MILALIYMSIGFLVGILFKYELDNRRMKKRVVIKHDAHEANINSSHKVQEYETILCSIKEMNENLAMNERIMRKEVQ
jgi:hypothetical protein